MDAVGMCTVCCWAWGRSPLEAEGEGWSEGVRRPAGAAEGEGNNGNVGGSPQMMKMIAHRCQSQMSYASLLNDCCSSNAEEAAALIYGTILPFPSILRTLLIPSADCLIALKMSICP